MPLKLTITSYQRLSPGQDTTKTLDRGTLSIGRASQNDWVLQDPERILSKSHCTVDYRNGGYVLTDLSVNGTFLNDSEERIERHQAVDLHDGDHFILGEYEIAVSLLPESESGGNTALEGPLTDIVPPSSNSDQRFTPIVSPERPHTAAPADILKPHTAAPADILKPSFSDIMAESQGGQEQQPQRLASQPGVVVTEPAADVGGPERASFEPPMLVAETPAAASLDELLKETASTPPTSTTDSASDPLIPDDWWSAPPAPAAAVTPAAAAPFSPPAALAKPAVPPLQGFEKAIPQPPPSAVAAKERATPPRAPSTPDPATRPEAAIPDGEVLLRAFLDGARLQRLRLPPEQRPEVMATLGAIFRETVQGLMEVLLARSDVKGEFRLDRTTMGPVENNPLKTPPGRPPLSPEEVMALLLVGWKEAYMPPIEAVHESFNDIKAHQMAVMAGIQAALNRLLARFDPANLETSLGQSVLDNIWPSNRKAKYWDLYTAEYHAIAREAEDDFNKLFGGEFARAYEERLRDH